MTATTATLVVAANLTKSYRAGETNPALEGVSVDIRAADRIAVVGRSGSGKSTLLQLVAGLDAPTAGELRWPGLGERDSLRPGKIAIMMQAPSLIPWLTVRENVALGLEITGQGKRIAEDRAAQALAAFGLGDLAAKLPDELSGGQAQRVSLVRAVATDPQLLLADEPTGQLDHETAGELMRSLLNWAERAGAAVVVATHDQAVAKRLTMRFVLDHGRVTTPLERMES